MNFGSSDFQATIIGEAVRTAVDSISVQLVSESGKLQVRPVSAQGLVADVEGTQIILNIGANACVSVGDQLSVERVGREIKDPETGKVIRRLTTPVGTIRIIEVDEVSSVAVAVSGSGFRVGDIVKLLPH